MRALVYTGPHQVELRDVPEPNPATGDVIVAVEAVGICGSDMHAWHGHDERRPAPLILGHEAAGRIASGPRKGERVTVNPLVTCGHCNACLSGRSNICVRRQIISMPPREGAFAERFVIPERNVLTIPDDLPIEKAALAEPIAVSWHAVAQAQRALHRPFPDVDAIVIGGGAIGLAAALCLSLFGASTVDVIESNLGRHAMLAAAGPFRISAPGDAASPGPASADVIIDAVGSDATRALASRLVRAGGVVIHTGLQGGSAGIDIRRMTLQEITFIGTYTYSMTDFRMTVTAIGAGKLGALDWFEPHPLDDGPRAFADLHAGRIRSAKVMLTL